jgi:hypothetical protein
VVDVVGGAHRPVNVGRTAGRDVRDHGAVRRVDAQQLASGGVAGPMAGDEGLRVL